MKRLLSILLCLLFSLPLYAQMNEEDEFLVGFRGGYIYSSTLKDVKNMVVPRARQPEIWPHTKEVARNGYSAGVFFHKRIPNGWPMVVQLDLAYSFLQSELMTDVPDTVFRQSATFKYQCFSGTLWGNWHPFLPVKANEASAFSGLHVGLGFGYNLLLKDNIVFESHDPSVDIKIEEYMNTYLTGKSQFIGLGKIGYEYFWNGKTPGQGLGIAFDARFGIGLNKAMKATSFIYDSDIYVRAQHIMFTAGIMIPLRR